MFKPTLVPICSILSFATNVKAEYLIFSLTSGLQGNIANALNRVVLTLTPPDLSDVISSSGPPDFVSGIDLGHRVTFRLGSFTTVPIHTAA